MAVLGFLLTIAWLDGLSSRATGQVPSSAPAPTAVLIQKGSATTAVRIQALPTIPASAVTTQQTPSGTSAAATRSASTSTPIRPGELPADVFAALTPEEVAAKAQAQAKQQARLQKIQQLNFDRRPSAILKAWSVPRDQALKALGTDSSSEPNSPAAGLSALARARMQAAGVEVSASGSSGSSSSSTETASAADQAFDRDLKALQLDVTLGGWDAVKATIARLEPELGKAVYGRLLESLASGPPNSGADRPGQLQMINGIRVAVPPPQQVTMERNSLSNRDILALIGLAPGDALDKSAIASLGRILALAIEQGNAVEDFVSQVRSALAAAEPHAPLTQRQAALLLFAAEQPIEAGKFLPALDEAVSKGDREALNLWARHDLALYERDKKSTLLEQAWTATQAALAAGEIDTEQKDEAILRAVELAPKVRKELGREWLESSFSTRPERGMEIISAIGVEASQGLQKRGSDTEFRLKALELQSLAVNTLLARAPERAQEWRKSLALLAGAWLKEADYSRRFDSSTSIGPRMQYDSFGNVYYMNASDPESPDMLMQRQGNMPQAIATGEILKNRPGDAWLDSIDTGMKPQFATVLAQLYLKVNEEDTAFPYIERLAATNPRQGRELAEEFLRTWTKNHDPNSQQLQRSRFFYVYGFESRAEGIPLTRSKQERNLVELGGWIDRIRKLPIGEIDEALLTKAFTACHSPAEVYRVEAINRVFGSFEALKPTTLASLIQQMRANLVGVWRQPDVQQQQKTRRKEKDIRAEVLRGYEVARNVVDQGLARYPDHWALVLARAAILHDENNYLQELERSPEYAPRRQRAMAEFQRAADLYLAAEPTLTGDEQSNDVFDMWFLAALGACDVGAIDDQSLADPKQPPRIREALGRLQGEDGDRHRSRFANALFTRLNGVKPSVKVRYLTYGLEIVGDESQAHDARKVLEYYKDLLTELKLVAAIDGPDVIAPEQPFGVFVNLLHTREIERESGGFGRYLQNQNTGGMFYYNYGRPLENYRDKFQEIVKQALGEQFEILSVTFQDEKVNSRATNDYGWRITPYAYLLLKARGPVVDKIAPLRLDLDFMDTSGYVVLPIESAAVPVEVSEKASTTRPFSHLEITQSLDERQADDGKLIVEVKATGQGLIPPIDAILDLDATKDGFDRTGVEDQGLLVSRFDPDSPENVVDSERSWLVSYQGRTDQKQRASVFHFPTARVDDATLIHQRYVDADLSKVDPIVTLESRYGKTQRSLSWPLILGLVGALALAGLAIVLWRRPRPARLDACELPDPLTPFSVIGLLRQIERREGLAPQQRAELNTSIARLERHYFSDENGEPDPDLRQVASTWLARSR
jgi:hypothetical protein